MSLGWERAAAGAGVAFVALYIAAFSLGIEVGRSDQAILDHYADSGARTREIAAFFVIAAAALAFLVFATAVRDVVERVSHPAAELAWAGAIGYAVLVLAGNAVSRAPAFASTESDFRLDPDTRRLLEDAGLLLFASGTLAAILLVVAASFAALRHRALPRWLGWLGVVAAMIMPLGVAFVGFLALFVWVLAASTAFALRRPRAAP